MSDYEFKCGDCGKYNKVHGTGDVPEFGNEVECISCGRISQVTSSFATLEVVKTQKVKKPSQLDKLNKEKYMIQVEGEQ